MNSDIDELYTFVFKGLLAEENLDRSGRVNKNIIHLEDQAIARALSLDILDDVHVHKAKQMAVVYSAIAAFENTVRDLVSKTLLDKFKADWWEKGVSQKIRDRAKKRMDDELQARWHAQRGQDPINYVTFGDLKNIMQNNWEIFEDLVYSLEWVAGIFEAVERSRNVIMHSGMLEKEDIERLGVNIRDWIKQIGA